MGLVPPVELGRVQGTLRMCQLGHARCSQQSAASPGRGRFWGRGSGSLLKEGCALAEAGSCEE